MTNQIQKADPAITDLDATEVKKFIDPQGRGSDSEHKFFLELCKSRGLNPFTKEVYFIKYGTSPAAVVVNVDTFVKKANSHPDYKGYTSGWIIGTEEAPKLTDMPFGSLLGAWCKVHRENKVDTTSMVKFSEYTTGKSRWQSAPYQMIEKCAITAAHRKAYTESFQGLYGFEEMDQAKENTLKNISPGQDTPIKEKGTKGFKEKLEKQQVKAEFVFDEKKPEQKSEDMTHKESLKIYNEACVILKETFATSDNEELKEKILIALDSEESEDMTEALRLFAEKYPENADIIKEVVNANKDTWKSSMLPHDWNFLINYMKWLKNLFPAE